MARVISPKPAKIAPLLPVIAIALVVGLVVVGTMAAKRARTVAINAQIGSNTNFSRTHVPVPNGRHKICFNFKVTKKPLDAAFGVYAPPGVAWSGNARKSPTCSPEPLSVSSGYVNIQANTTSGGMLLESISY